jgi:GNAT superfamily N-acetyltransferase
MDEGIFWGAADEFKDNREWWVIEVDGQIVAYCGSAYKEGICIFVRAWVNKKYRGKGLHSKLIKTRVKAASLNACKWAITYTTHDNVNSANNLFKNGFRLYIPEYRYAGNEMIYFRKQIK